MLFSLLKHYLDNDTALKLSQSVYCFATSISHGVDNYFPRLWDMGISDAIFFFLFVYIFYSFQYCDSMSRPLAGVCVFMASFSDGYLSENSSTVMRVANSLLGGGRYIIDPELRGEKVSIVNWYSAGQLDFNVKQE